IATNGVPIFNYHTNTGVDSFLDGQLDNYGGHCGRGDDYHYHTAPLHLISLGQTTYNLPIAFAFDGFAVYGSLEPTGATMATLDANHGHYFNGVYHYHGTATAPYMIGNMVGQVTEDATLQIIPQPQGNPVRTENWTPLNGALITSCVANASNGYNTLYSLNGVSGYATNFTITGTTYTFKYVTPTGTTTTNYNGPALCTVPNLNVADVIAIEKNITIYPNPATDVFKINLGNDFLENDVEQISIYDIKGSLVYKIQKFNSSIDIKKLEKGTYFVKIQFSNSVITKKLLVK
uniref:T9SS type A sorting domain-containing protein n=1 Tax=Flavobacterium sp. TaxID=239 RepID=UPI00375324CC